MTAQLPPASYTFPPLSTAAYHHDPSPSTTVSEPSTHDATRSHTLDTTPLSSTATPSSSYFSHSFASPPLSNLDELPKLGSIRCYWTILSPSLDYVYLDPLLEQHLGEFAQQFVGSNLLDFVHPDERDQLAEDLLPRADRIAGVETAGVFGSVTRLRYRRLVGILRKLGCRDVPTLPDADKYALDEDYLNLDLTTSWIAGNGIMRGNTAGGGSVGQLGQGAVLAFFHVIGDKDHVKNNDVFDRGDWTNWCGVQVDEHRYFTPSRCQALVEVLETITSSSSRPSTSSNSEEDSKSALLASLHGLSSETTEGPPPHVFQILDRNGKAIVSFPTPQDEAGRKRYEVESYAALAREVVARPRGAANAKTSCTKRYRSKHPVMKDSILTTIESVVIMYGSITFACFQTAGIYLTIARKAALGLNQPAMSPQPGSTVNDFNLEDVPATVPNPKAYLSFNKRLSPYGRGSPSLGSPPVNRIKTEPVSSRPRLSIPPSDPSFHGAGGPMNEPSASSRGPYRPAIESEYGTNGGVSPTVASASAILGSISSNHAEAAPPSQQPPLSQSQQHANEYSYPSAPFPYFRQNGASPGSLYPPSYTSHSHSTSPHQAPQSSNAGYFPPPATTQPTSSHESSMPTYEDARDPPPSGSPGIERPDLPSKKVEPNASAKEAKEPKKSRNRPEGPVFKPGIKACESCGSTESPEWRKGPSGSKSLCNACGLRYARSVARQKKLTDQATEGPPVKKKKGKKALKGETAATSSALPSSATTEISSLPATSSAHTTYEPAFSRSDSTYSPFYTSAPSHGSSYALVASHPPSSSGPPTSSASVSTYPASTSGYYPATTTYPYSSYPATSTPILTHIPIHHTLAATLAPLSAAVSVHSHDYPRNGPLTTAIPHTSSFSPAPDHLHALSQGPGHAGLYTHRYHHSNTSVGGDWPPSFAPSEMHPPTTSTGPTPHSTYSSASSHHAMTSQSTSPHLRHPPTSSYQPYQGWNSERHDTSRQDGGGAGRATGGDPPHRLSATGANDYSN